MPVLYVVNIDVRSTLREACASWLREHVAQMKTSAGLGDGITTEIIERGTVTMTEDIENTSLKQGTECAGFTVKYVVPTREQLQDYLDNRAAVMRGDAVKHFGDNFRGYRTITDL